MKNVKCIAIYLMLSALRPILYKYISLVYKILLFQVETNPILLPENCLWVKSSIDLTNTKIAGLLLHDVTF